MALSRRDHYHQCCLCPVGTYCVDEGDEATGRRHTHRVTKENMEFVCSMQPTDHGRVEVGAFFCCVHLNDHDFVRMHRRDMTAAMVRVVDAGGREAAEKAAGYRPPSKRRLNVAAVADDEPPIIVEPLPKRRAPSAVPSPIVKRLAMQPEVLQQRMRDLLVAPLSASLRESLQLIRAFVSSGGSVDDRTALALFDGILAAPPPPPPAPLIKYRAVPMPVPMDIATISTDRLSASLFDYERLVDDVSICRTLLGVDPDELVFVAQQLALVGVTRHRNRAKQDAVCLLAGMRRAFSFNELSKLLGFKHYSKLTRRIKDAGARLSRRFIANEQPVGHVKLVSLEELLDIVKANSKRFDGEAWLGSVPFIFIDGSSLETDEPKGGDLSRLTYVIYKGHHGYRWTCVCAANGRVLMITRLEEGSLDDAKVWQRAKVAETLEMTYPQQVRAAFAQPLPGKDFERQLCVGADKGYYGVNSGAACKVVVTASGLKEAKAQGKKQGQGVIFSSKIARARAVVERVFGFLKRRHEILRYYDCPASNVDTDMLDNMIMIGCVLLNRRIELGKQVSL